MFCYLFVFVFWLISFFNIFFIISLETFKQKLLEVLFEVTLYGKCLYSEFFWYVYPEFGLITDQKNSEYDHFSRSVSSSIFYQFDENISGSQNLEFVLLKFPYKHTTCIPRWNDVATVVSTVFQRVNHVVCLHSGTVIILVRLVFNKGGWSCNPFQVNFPS